jgi:hypothetical protein
MKYSRNRVLKIISGFGVHEPRHPTEELYSVKKIPLHLINAFQLIFYAYIIILQYPAFYNDIAPWMRFKKASNDAAVKNIIKTKKIELPHILIYFYENSLN